MKGASWTRRAMWGLMWRAGLWSVAACAAWPGLRAEDPGVTAGDPQSGGIETLVAQGRALFERDWSQHPPAWESRDGLGPLFNAISCAACHAQGGLGGGGANEKNVDLLSARSVRERPRRSDLRRFIQIAQRLHPGFSVERPNLVLHRFGTPATEYAQWRSALLGGVEEEESLAEDGSSARRVGSVILELSQRNTPALFGAGIINAVAHSELVAEAGRQKLAGAVSGRVARTAGGRPGRFGWRGQVSTLHEFVSTACANELGLHTVQHHQAANPSIGGGEAETSRRTDLTTEHTLALTAFVASLPAPTRPEDWTLDRTREALQGETVFNSIGCSACHVEDLGPAEGIYSDLLLHDMGASLSDPVPSLPDFEDVPSRRTRSSGYSGGVSLTSTTRATTDIHQEWRTPPLWGASATAPYLHDGRAATLEEAIRLHGGEALPSAKRYRGLNEENRGAVLTFLASLVPPQEDAWPAFEVAERSVNGEPDRSAPTTTQIPGRAPVTTAFTFGPFGFQFGLVGVPSSGTGH